MDSADAAPPIVVAGDFSPNRLSNPSRSKLLRSKGKFEKILSSNAEAVEVVINPSGAVVGTE